VFAENLVDHRVDVVDGHGVVLDVLADGEHDPFRHEEAHDVVVELRHEFLRGRKSVRHDVSMSCSDGKHGIINNNKSYIYLLFQFFIKYIYYIWK